MESGVVTTESLSQLLRNISQRRRQGTLSVRSAKHEVRVLFLQGRVVSVADTRISESAAVEERLRRAAFMASDRPTGLSSWAEILAAVGQKVGATLATQVVQRAYRAEMLDRLYALNAESGAVFNFSSHMVEYEKDLAPNISVGQLLLDLVALESDGAQFEKIFPGDRLVSRNPSVDAAVSEEEGEILQQLTQETSVADIWGQVLLSRYHFMEAMLSLHERGLISAGERVPSTTNPVGATPAFGEDIFAMLDKSIDETVAAEVDEDPAPTVELPPLGVAAAAPQVQGFRESLSMISARWLQSSAVPSSITWLALAAGMLAPFTLWWHVFEFFGGK